MEAAMYSGQYNETEYVEVIRASKLHKKALLAFICHTFVGYNIKYMPNEEEVFSEKSIINKKIMSQSGTSVWGNTETVTPCSLNDVMSEELATQLDDDNFTAVPQDENVDLSQFMNCDDLNTSNDLLLAQILQHEFDREHDKEIKIKEDKFNSQRKVKVSYQDYRAVHPSQWDEDDTDEEAEESQEIAEQQLNFPGRGMTDKGKNIVTKHDATTCGRKNANRVMEQFLPEIPMGDAIGIDMKLSNHVYNKLKTHSKSENKRSHRLHEKKEHSTAEHAMDAKTRLILFEQVNNEFLEDVNGIVSAGKEAVIFHANTGVNPKIDGFHKVLPPEVAIKVFKTTLTEFKNRSDYVKGDMRFFKNEFKKQNPHKIMRLWADKEVYNLKLMRRYGIPCPKVIMLKKHVLVMTFIGSDQVAAPKLKDARLDVAEGKLAYEQCVQNMKKLYRGCQLVHADLSEYNMLWHNDTVYFIDVAQAVDRMHPHAHEFLLRDCRNVTTFFKNLGVADVFDEYTLFKEITHEGHQFLMAVFNTAQGCFQVQEYGKDQDKVRSGNSDQNYPFDIFLNRATKKCKGPPTTNQEPDNVEVQGSPPNEIDPEIQERLSVLDSEGEDIWSKTNKSKDDFEVIDKIPELSLDSFKFVNKEAERPVEVDSGQVATETTSATCTNHDPGS